MNQQGPRLPAEAPAASTEVKIFYDYDSTVRKFALFFPNVVKFMAEGQGKNFFDTLITKVGKSQPDSDQIWSVLGTLWGSVSGLSVLSYKLAKGVAIELIMGPFLQRRSDIIGEGVKQDEERAQLTKEAEELKAEFNKTLSIKEFTEKLEKTPSLTDEQKNQIKNVIQTSPEKAPKDVISLNPDNPKLIQQYLDDLKNDDLKDKSKLQSAINKRKSIETLFEQILKNNSSITPQEFKNELNRIADTISAGNINTLPYKGILESYFDKKVNLTDPTITKPLIDELNNRSIEIDPSNTPSSVLANMKKTEILGQDLLKLNSSEDKSDLDQALEENLYNLLHIKIKDANDPEKFKNAIQRRTGYNKFFSEQIKGLDKKNIIEKLLKFKSFLKGEEMDLNIKNIFDINSKSSLNNFLNLKDKDAHLGVSEDWQNLYEEIESLIDEYGDLTDASDIQQPFKKRERSIKLANKLINNKDALEAYNEAMLEVSAYTIVGIDNYLALPQSLPEDIRNEFKAAKFEKGLEIYNPIILLGFTSFPGEDDVKLKIDNLTREKNDYDTNKTHIYTTLNDLKNEVSNNQMSSLDKSLRILSSMPNQDVEILRVFSNNKSLVESNLTIDELNLEDFNGNSIKLTKPSTLVALKNYFMGRSQNPTEDLSDQYSETVSLIKCLNDGGETNTQLMDLLESLKTFVKKYNKYDTELFKRKSSTEPDNYSALDFISKISETNYYTFDILYEALNGDFTTLLLHNQNIGFRDTSDFMTSVIESSINLKLSTATTLKEVYAEPEKLARLKKAHRDHMLKIIEGDIYLERKGNDPQGVIKSLKEYIQNDKSGNFNNIDLNIFETILRRSPEAVTDKILTRDNFLKFKIEILKISEFVIRKIEAFQMDISQLDQDSQKEVLNLNTLLNYLITLGVRINESKTNNNNNNSIIEVDNRMLKLYLNGLTTKAFYPEPLDLLIGRDDLSANFSKSKSIYGPTLVQKKVINI